MVGIRTSGPPEPVADEIAHWDEADYVVVTAGQFDLLVELVCADRRALLDVTNRIRSLPDVVSTETFLYLELWKQLYDWGAGRARTASDEERVSESPTAPDVRLENVVKRFDDDVRRRRHLAGDPARLVLRAARARPAAARRRRCG